MALYVGARVQARYMDGDAWFDGKVTRVTGKDSYSLFYDDGDAEDNVPKSRIRVPSSNVFPVGAIVEARFGGGEYFFRGQVIAVNGGGQSYDIHYDDGDTETNVKASWVHAVEGVEDGATPEAKFPPGSAVEALFGGGDVWFPGKVVHFNGADDTYVIDYDDGDHEDSVPSALMRLPLSTLPVEASSLPHVPIPTQVSHNSVYALFGGGNEWYLADIVIQHPSGACDLVYHDGDIEHQVQPSMIRPLPEVGDAVEGRYGGGEEWHTGRIVNNSHSGFYDIDYDDGDKERNVEAFFVRPIFDPNEQRPIIVPPSPKKTEPVVKKTQPISEPPAVRKQPSFSTRTKEPEPPSTPGPNNSVYTEPSESKLRTLEVPDAIRAEFSDKEIDSFRQVFSLYDADNSGAVDREELSDILEQLGEMPDKEQLDRLIEEADEDGDGEIDFQEFCNIMQKSKNGAFGTLLSRANKELNPTGVFRDYALPSITKLDEAVAALKAYAAQKNSKMSPDAFDPVEEMLRLVPICWQRSEKLIGLGMIYRAPPEKLTTQDAPPKNLREKVLALTEKSVALAKSKLTKDKVSSNHLKCLFEVIAAVKWLSIDFTGMAKPRENEGDSAASRVEKIKGKEPKILTATAVALPGMGNEEDRNSVRRMSAKIMTKAAENEKSLARKQSERSMRMSEAEYGPSGNAAAIAFLEGCREGLLFFNSKLKSPIQLDESTEEGKLDALNRKFATALLEALDGLIEYVKKFHPDGLKWQWKKVISKEESNAILQKSQNEEKKSALQMFKAAGQAVQAANRFGMLVKDKNGGVVSPRGSFTSPTPKADLGEGIVRLGGTLFRQTLPEDICIALEKEGEKILSELAWPKSDKEQSSLLVRRVSGVGMEHSALLGKMSFWDEKVMESNKKKIEEKSYEITAERRRSSMMKHADEKQETMDISTANALILSACSDTTLMREAMEVVKKHRAQIAETIDGGQAHTGISKLSPTKIKWGGLVKANKFEEKVAEHNAKLQQEAEEAKALKAAGQKNAKVFAKSTISIIEGVKVIESAQPSNEASKWRKSEPSIVEEEEKEEKKAEPVAAVRSDPLPGTLRSRPSYRMHDRMTAMQDRIETPKVVKRKAAFKVGDRIEGLFAGHDWFLGRVVGMIDNDQQFVYDVLYDDGDSEQGVKENMLRKIPEMKVNVGDKVRGRFGGGMLYFPATVKAKTARGYDLDYADGDREYTIDIGMLAPVVEGLNEGAHVEARYGGGDEWFAAVIVRVTEEGFDLHYNDGDFEHDVPREWIREHA